MNNLQTIADKLVKRGTTDNFTFVRECERLSLSDDEMAQLWQILQYKTGRRTSPHFRAESNDA